MIFVGLNHDFVPYSPRDPSSLKGNIANHGVKPEELAETELKIREEVRPSVFCAMSLFSFWGGAPPQSQWKEKFSMQSKVISMCWTIVDNKVSLPVSLSTHEHKSVSGNCYGILTKC